ncbi:MAG: crossover junction endodeoxyribonuclease RuvC [Alphaproteobacteria bacterium]
MRLMGLDPGLRVTGWGVIDVEGNRLRHAGNGVVRSDGGLDTPARLVQLFDGISQVLAEYKPDEAAVEETFVNRNPGSTLKLGLARGVVLLVPARAGLKVSEYAPNLIKKSLVGHGHAAKEQVAMMVRILLPGAELESADAADALAVAICHAHHTAGRREKAAAGDHDEAGAAAARARAEPAR